MSAELRRQVRARVLEAFPEGGDGLTPRQVASRIDVVPRIVQDHVRLLAIAGLLEQTTNGQSPRYRRPTEDTNEKEQRVTHRETIRQRLEETQLDEEATGLTVPELAELTGIPREQIQSLVADMIRKGELSRSGKGGRADPFRYDLPLEDEKTAAEISDAENEAGGSTEAADLEAADTPAPPEIDEAIDQVRQATGAPPELVIPSPELEAYAEERQESADAVELERRCNALAETLGLQVVIVRKGDSPDDLVADDLVGDVAGRVRAELGDDLRRRTYSFVRAQNQKLERQARELLEEGHHLEDLVVEHRPDGSDVRLRTHAEIQAELQPMTGDAELDAALVKVQGVIARRARAARHEADVLEAAETLLHRLGKESAL